MNGTKGNNALPMSYSLIIVLAFVFILMIVVLILGNYHNWKGITFYKTDSFSSVSVFHFFMEIKDQATYEILYFNLFSVCLCVCVCACFQIRPKK